MIYSLTRTHRSRGVSLTVTPGGEVRVTAHPLYPGHKIEEFLRAKAGWIARKVEQMKDWDPDLAAVGKLSFLGSLYCLIRSNGSMRTILGLVGLRAGFT